MFYIMAAVYYIYSVRSPSYEVLVTIETHDEVRRNSRARSLSLSLSLFLSLSANSLSSLTPKLFKYMCSQSQRRCTLTRRRQRGSCE